MAYISGTTTVYAGPGSNGYYKALDTLNLNHTVYLIHKEGNWLYVQYTPANSTKQKRGYVLDVFVAYSETVPTFTATKSPRFIDASCTFYYGPGATFQTAAILSGGRGVMYLNKKENDTLL